MRGVICADVGDRSDDDLRAAARSAWSPADTNVVSEVTAPETIPGDGESPIHVVLIDCGVKEHIIQSLERRGVRVTVVPFDTPYAEIQKHAPDGVLTSPGPGDPERAAAAVPTIQEIVNAGQPYFGVCLGHQLLALAIGAST